MKLHDLETEGYLLSDTDKIRAREILNQDSASNSQLPWISRFALGLGAWLAGAFLMGFLGVLLEPEPGPGMVIIGLIMISGSVALFRLKKGVFLEQLALAISFAGHLMFCIGLHDSFPIELLGPLVGALILCGPVYWLSKHSVQRFLSVLLVWICWWVLAISERGSLEMTLLVMGVAMLVAVLGILSGRLVSGGAWRPAMWASLAGLNGFLFWLADSSTWFSSTPEDLGFLFGTIAAIGISGLLWYLTQPSGKATIPFGLFAVLLIWLGTEGAAGVVCGLGLMTIAHARGDRFLEKISIGCLGLFLIAFYYHLGIPLVQKSILLMVSGAVFLGFRLLFFPKAFTPAPEEPKPAKSPILIIAIILVNCVLALLIVNAAIMKKQAIVDSGRTVYLALAPVDPRSLMQGDYMALAYAFPRGDAFKAAMKEAPTRGRLFLKLDEKNVGTFSRAATGEAKLPPEEVPLKYRKWRRGWRFGIESFFFQEGLGSAYENAKFAELRVDPNGQAVLVNLRGKELELLSPTTGTASDRPAP